MAANEAIPYWDPADSITCYAKAAVTGKRFVSISGARKNGQPQVSPTGNGLGSCLGIAAYDAAADAQVLVWRDPIVPVTAGAALTAGQLVQSDANGQAIVKAAGICLGMALDDAGVGEDCPIDRSVTA